MNLKNKQLKAAYDAAQNYWKTKKDTDAEWENLARSYTGDLLKTKRGEQDELLRTAKQSMNNTLTDAPQSLLDDVLARRTTAIEAGKKLHLDSSKITPDYALLSLPVVLNGVEVETLYYRNWTDELFVRALRGYIGKHNVVLPHTELKDIYVIAVETIRNVFGRVQHFASTDGGAGVMRDNPHMMEEMDAQITAAIASAQDSEAIQEGLIAALAKLGN